MRNCSLFRQFVLCCSVICSSVMAEVKTEMFPELPFALTEAHLVGESQFTYFFWDVYDASLYASQGKWNPDAPFALKLTYARNFKGDNIASRSVKEMRSQNPADTDTLARWQSEMTRLFPDVKDGDQLIGIADSMQHSVFYFNSKKLGEINDVAFTQAFFNIWLGEKTSQPDMRKSLLGELK